MRVLQVVGHAIFINKDAYDDCCSAKGLEKQGAAMNTKAGSRLDWASRFSIRRKEAIYAGSSLRLQIVGCRCLLCASVRTVTVLWRWVAQWRQINHRKLKNNAGIRAKQI